jgi:hypothetical protein
MLGRLEDLWNGVADLRTQIDHVVKGFALLQLELGDFRATADAIRSLRESLLRLQRITGITDSVEPGMSIMDRVASLERVLYSLQRELPRNTCRKD